jgi:hypothetical protein
MNLGFDDKPTRPCLFRESNRGFMRGLRGVRNFASLDGDAEGLKNAFPLVFVDVHGLEVV